MQSHSFIFFQNVDHKCKFRSKKGMLPFIELNGEEIADSNIVIDTLSKKFEKVSNKIVLAETLKSHQDYYLNF